MILGIGSQFRKKISDPVRKSVLGASVVGITAMGWPEESEAASPKSLIKFLRKVGDYTSARAIKEGRIPAKDLKRIRSWGKASAVQEEEYSLGGKFASISPYQKGSFADRLSFDLEEGGIPSGRASKMIKDAKLPAYHVTISKDYVPGSGAHEIGHIGKRKILGEKAADRYAVKVTQGEFTPIAAEEGGSEMAFLGGKMSLLNKAFSSASRALAGQEIKGGVIKEVLQSSKNFRKIVFEDGTSQMVNKQYVHDLAREVGRGTYAGKFAAEGLESQTTQALKSLARHEKMASPFFTQKHVKAFEKEHISRVTQMGGQVADTVMVRKDRKVFAMPRVYAEHLESMGMISILESGGK